MIKASVFIVTLNEAPTIAGTLRSVKCFDEVIVVDSGSTDGTIDIALREGARVLHHDWEGFSKQKSYAMSLCRNDWCFNLDGDEVVSPSLLKEVRALINSGEWDLIRFRIEDMFMGAPMHPKSRKRMITRVFRKSMVSYPEERQVHENIVSHGRLTTASATLTHWGYDDLGTYVAKQMRYASLRAEDKYRSGKRANGLKLVGVFPLTFIKVFFFRGLWWSGWRGLIQSIIEAFYGFLKEAHLVALQRKEKLR